ncbi:UV excision repair protein rhp23 [Golovinomyces cichoracearum]|uniref:UV excision repair protein RAD23 n=1 Tax=Golovinomyces cichoracearum TaxID=62708 RepID=A0A420HF94_9PEZI|nr:UV excision repair protein rhp23 [Golovinomyces cichoracearum]
MKLSFRDLKQNKFIIEAEPSDLISEVKERIANEKGWDASTQKLIYSGKILQDANTVESYKIEEKGFIVCMTAKPKIPTASTSSSTSKSFTPAAAAVSPKTTQSSTENASSMNSTASTVPAATNPASDNNSGLVSSGISIGAERTAQIAELESMGFERSQIDAAMRAAFFNSERAVEYLLNGIPENLQGGLNPPTPAVVPTTAPSSESENAPRNLFDAAAALNTGAGSRGEATRSAMTGTSGGANPSGLGNLDFLRNNPQFQQLRQVVQQQPQMLEPILQQVGAGNPHLAALIGNHSHQFLQLLSEEGENDAALPPGAHPISVTEDERAAIDRLCHLGFPRDLAIEAYFACDKNEELAANYLFDQPDVDEQ